MPCPRGWTAHGAGRRCFGVRVVTELRPDVVLLDVRMAGMDGLRDRGQAVAFAHESGLVTPGR